MTEASKWVFFFYSLYNLGSSFTTQNCCEKKENVNDFCF